MEREIIKEIKIWKAKVKVHERWVGLSRTTRREEKKKKSNKEQGMGPTVSQRNGEKLENK
jgi:hypothetical protein